MKTYPPVPNVLRIEVQQTIHGDQYAMNRFFQPYSGTAPTSAELSIFANDVFQAWSANMYQLQSSDVGVDKVVVTDLTSPTAASGEAAGSGVGTRAGTNLQAATCAVLQFGVPRRYRGGHPRMYLAVGVTSDLGTGNSWDAAFISLVPTQWVNFLAGFELSPWGGATLGKQVNVSYFAGYENVTYPSGRIKAVPSFRPTPVVDTISAFSLNKQVGSQRRRNQQGS